MNEPRPVKHAFNGGTVIVEPGLVSVVIAAFNAGRYIRETLDSIFAQTYAPLEVIVADDGSTDNTADVVRAYGARVRYLHQQNSGGGAAPRNQGAIVATGEFLSFFDSDDVMHPEKITSQVEFLSRHPEAVAVTTNYRNFSTAGDDAQTYFDSCTELKRIREAAGSGDLVLSTEAARDLMLVENIAITSAMVYRRRAFVGAGGFDASLFVGEDLELLYRVSGAGPIGIIDDVSFRRRLHDANVSNRKEFNLREKIVSRQRMLDGEWSGERRDVLKRRLGELHFLLSDYLARNASVEAVGHLRSALAYGEPLASVATCKVAAKILVGALRPGQRQ